MLRVNLRKDVGTMSRLSEESKWHLEIQAKKCWLCKDKCFEGEIYMLIWDQIETENFHRKLREWEGD